MKILNLSGRIATKRLIKSIAGHFFNSYLRYVRNFPPVWLIMMYHRVTPELPSDYHDPAMFITSKTLKMHASELKRHFALIQLDHSQDFLSLKPRCSFTFDDGWCDNYTNAFPILVSDSIPATIFLSTGFIDTNRNFWFEDIYRLANSASLNNLDHKFIQIFRSLCPSWPHRSIDRHGISSLIYSLKSLPSNSIEMIVSQASEKLSIHTNQDRSVLNLNEIREMCSQGIALGAHSVNHRILTALDRNVMEQEILISKKDIENFGYRHDLFFSFPNGNWDHQSLLAVKQNGFVGAVTTQLGFNTKRSNKFLLKRIALHESISDSPQLLWFRILQALYSCKGNGNQSWAQA